MIQLAGDLDPEHPESAADAERWDAMTLQDYADTQQLDPGAALLVQSDYRGNFNAQLHEVSLLFALQQAVVDASLPESGVETMRIAAGNSALPLAMARDLGGAVRLGVPVTRVDRHPWGVRVHTTDGAGTTATEDAAHLVLAAPPPGLRGIRFDPPLPADQAAVIDQLDLGHALKVSTEYRSRFWVAEGLSGFTITDLPFGIAWDSTDSMPGGAGRPGVLTQFVTGDAAAAGAALGGRGPHRLVPDRSSPPSTPRGTTSAPGGHHDGLGRRALDGRWLCRLRPRAARPLLADPAADGRARVVRRRAHRGAGRLHGERGPLRPPRGRRHRTGAAAAVGQARTGSTTVPTRSPAASSRCRRPGGSRRGRRRPRSARTSSTAASNR